MKAPWLAGRLVRGPDDRKKRAGKAQHSLRDGRIHVRERDGEGLDFIGHGIWIPIGIRENKAMLTVIARAALDIELRQLRSAEFPRIRRRGTDADRGIVV